MSYLTYYTLYNIYYVQVDSRAGIPIENNRFYITVFRMVHRLLFMTTEKKKTFYKSNNFCTSRLLFCIVYLRCGTAGNRICSN